MAEFLIDTYPKLIQGLKMRLSAAEEFFELTSRQKTEIEQEDIDAFNKSLAERAVVIERIDAMNSELNEALEVYRKYKPGTSAGDSAIGEIAGIIDKTTQTLEDSRKLDEDNAEAIGIMMRETVIEIKKLSKSRDGIEKYAQKDMQYSPGYFDERQ